MQNWIATGALEQGILKKARMQTCKQTIKHKQSNQIEYKICQAAQKSILQNARSYTGTEVSSDNCLLVTKIRIERFFLYKNSKVKFDAPFDTDRLERQEVERKC